MAALDVTAGRVVKGINFVELHDAGDPVEIAARYNEQGAGEILLTSMDHLADGIQTGGADAVLAASIFHYGEYTVQQAKQRMRERGIPVRL